MVATNPMQVSKFKLPFDNGAAACPPAYPQAPVVNQIQPQNEKLPANSFLKESSQSVWAIQQPNHEQQHQPTIDHQINFDDSKYKNKYLVMSSAPSPPVIVPQPQATAIIAAATTTPSMLDPQSPRFTDLLKMSTNEKN